MSANDTRIERRSRAEHLAEHVIGWDINRRQADLRILLKRARLAEVELTVNADSELMDDCGIDVPDGVEITTKAIVVGWPAVAKIATRISQSVQERADVGRTTPVV